MINFRSFALTLLVSGITWQALGQYPEVPPELEDKTNQIMEAEKERLDELWQEQLPVLIEDARRGKPYIPWAAYPMDLPQADIPAFPGAEGGGMYSFGGRGGKVYVVTSLEDSGPGTLRKACEAAGPRIVVFNVAGIIRLKTPIKIRAPYITIAGQTAPGNGVCVAGETFWINTHDVVIRHMRFRRGETDVTRRDDALGGEGVGNVIIDHCSVSWGLDENLSFYRNMYDPGDGNGPRKLPAVNVTIQNSISSEALDTYNHAFGSTIGGLNSTFMCNLWAHNTGRNPSVGMYGDFTFVNNVLFNWQHRTVDGGDNRSLFNIINNYLKPGPITPKDEPVSYRFLKPESSRSIPDSAVFGRAYVNGNIAEGNPAVSKDNWAGGVQIGGGDIEDYEEFIRVDKPFSMAPVRIMTAKEAYEYVLENAGATLPERDAVDKRVVEEVRTGKLSRKDGLERDYVPRRLPADSYKKGIIVDISQVGGYPEYTGTPYTDSDGDGMPSPWESRYGLDPHDPADANEDLNEDGYTNIEMYINGIDPESKVDWTDPENNYDTLAGRSPEWFR